MDEKDVKKIIITIFIAISLIIIIGWGITHSKTEKNEKEYLGVEIFQNYENKKTWLNITNNYNRSLMIEIHLDHWKEPTPQDSIPPTIHFITKDGGNASEIRTSLSKGDTMTVDILITTNDVNFHSGTIVVMAYGYITMEGGEPLTVGNDEQYLEYLG